jgi:hypothetical protein
VKSRGDTNLKLWSKNVWLVREPRKKPGKKSLSVLSEGDEEGRLTSLEEVTTEMIVLESVDNQPRIGNQKSETLRQHPSRNLGDTELRT